MEQKPFVKFKIWGGFFLLLGNFIYSLIRYVLAFANVERLVVSNNIIYVLVAAALPLLWWFYSTIDDNWNYYYRKKATLWLAIINALMVSLMPLWSIVFDKWIVKIVATVKVGRNMTPFMVLMLCRFAIAGTVFALGAGLFAAIKAITDKPTMMEKIERFRWSQAFDLRENKAAKYDLCIARDLNTGKLQPIFERDRFTQMLVNGASGTGKTSSVAKPATVMDLDKKMYNAIRRQEGLERLVREGKARVRLPYQTEYQLIKEAMNGGFKDDMSADILVEPLEQYEKEFIKIKRDNPDCGITIMAPNPSLNKDIIKLAGARHIQINVIDPIMEYEDENVRNLGMNPFYINPDLEPEEKVRQIKHAAKAFSEVITAVNEINGPEDVYFRGINTSVTTNVAIVMMLDAALKGAQTNITEIQECIGELANLKKPMDEIQNTLHVKIKVEDMTSKPKGKTGGNAPGMAGDDSEDADRDSGDINSKRDKKNKSEDEIKSEYKFHFIGIKNREDMIGRYRDTDISIEEYNELLHWISENFYQTLHFVMQELLGSGREKMFDQSRGLRNLIDQFLMDPKVKRILSAPVENILDWDQALANSEITVINTAIELGKESSTALGIFLMLNMQLAVYRRPKDSPLLTNHFLYVDEASQYMHPMYEDIFVFYRQYKVGACLMIQSLEQMDKNPNTSYLKDTLLSAGTHIVFGRLSAKDMREYEELSGRVTEDVVQVSQTSNAEIDNNASISRMKRTTPTEKARMQGTALRYRGFQEVTIFQSINEAVQPPYIAKLSFEKKADYKDRHIKYVDWSKYFDSNWLLAYKDIGATSSTNKNDSIAFMRAASTGIKTDYTRPEGTRDNDTVPPVKRNRKKEEEAVNEQDIGERTAGEEMERAERKRKDRSKSLSLKQLGGMPIGDIFGDEGEKKTRTGNTEDDASQEAAEGAYGDEDGLGEEDTAEDYEAPESGNEAPETADSEPDAEDDDNGIEEEFENQISKLDMLNKSKGMPKGI